MATLAATATMSPSVVYQFAVLTMAVVLLLASRTGERVRRAGGVPAR